MGKAALRLAGAGCFVVMIVAGCEPRATVRGGDADRDAASDAGFDGDSPGSVDADRRVNDAGDDADQAFDAEVDGQVDAEFDSDADDDEPPRRRSGFVVVTEGRSEAGDVNSSVVARFRFHRHVTWCGYNFELFGDCYLFSANVPDCEPPCGEDQICSWNDDCSLASCVEPVDPVELFDAGPISVLGATYQDDVTCTTVDGAYVCDLDGEADFWEAADTVVISALGATYPGFSVEVVAPSPLLVTTDVTAWTLASFDGTSPVIVEWEATAPASAVEISFSTDMVTLSCLSPDRGYFVVPADGLGELGEASEVHVSVVRSNAGIDHEGLDGEVKAYAEDVGLEMSVQ